MCVWEAVSWSMSVGVWEAVCWCMDVGVWEAVCWCMGVGVEVGELVYGCGWMNLNLTLW